MVESQRNSRRKSIAGLPESRTSPATAETSRRRRMSLGPGVPRPNAPAASATRVIEQRDGNESVQRHSEETTPMEQEQNTVEDGLLLMPMAYDPRRHSLGPGVEQAQGQPSSRRMMMMEEDRRLSMGPGVEMNHPASHKGHLPPSLASPWTDGSLPTPGPEYQTTPRRDPAMDTPASNITSSIHSKRSRMSALTPSRLQLRADEARQRQLAKQLDQGAQHRLSSDAPSQSAATMDGNDSELELKNVPGSLDPKGSKTLGDEASDAEEHSNPGDPSNQPELVIERTGIDFLGDTLHASRPEGSTQTVLPQRASMTHGSADAVRCDSASKAVHEDASEPAKDSYPEKLRALEMLLDSDSPVLLSNSRYHGPLSLSAILTSPNASASKEAKKRASPVAQQDETLNGEDKESNVMDTDVDVSSTQSPYMAQSSNDTDDGRVEKGSKTLSRERRRRTLDSLFLKHEELTSQIDRTDSLLKEKMIGLDNTTLLGTSPTNDPLTAELNQSPSFAESLLLSPAQNTRSAKRRRKLESMGKSPLGRSLAESLMNESNQNQPTDDAGAWSLHVGPSDAARSPLPQLVMNNQSPNISMQISDDPQMTPATNGTLQPSCSGETTTQTPTRNHLKESILKKGKFARKLDSDSPARNTRSAEKKRLSLYSGIEPDQTHDNNDERRFLEDTVDVDSKGTGNVSRTEEVGLNSEETGLSVRPNRGKPCADENDGKGHFVDKQESLVASSDESKHAQERLPDEERLRLSSSKKSVAFGSSEYVRFNVRSPAASLTPIRNTMQFGLESFDVAPHGEAHPAHSGDPEDQTSILEEEQTIELEPNMAALFQQPQLLLQPPKYLDTVLENPSHALNESDATAATSSLMDIEETCDLATNFSLLLHPAASIREDNILRESVSRLSFEKQSAEADATNPQDLGEPKTGDSSSTVEFAEQHGMTAEFKINLQSPKSMPSSVQHSVSKRYRRTPRSGRRLTLTPRRRLSLAPNGEVILNDHTLKITPALNFDLSPRKKEVLNLNIGEVVELIQRLMSPFSRVTTDMVNEVFQLVKASRSPILQERYQLVLSEVCIELEQNIKKDVDFHAPVTGEDESVDYLLVLQKEIRDSSSDSTNDDFHNIANTARLIQEMDLDCWLLQVAERFSDMLDTLTDEIMQFESSVDEKVKFLEDEAEVLSVWHSKALNKARRRSLDRRKCAASSLEEEISELQAQLNRIETSMNESQKDFEVLTELDLLTKSSLTAENDVKLLNTQTARLDIRLTIVSQFSRLKPVHLREDEIAYEYIGPNPDACFELKCRPCEEKQWRCFLQPCKALFSKFVGRMLKSVTPLYQTRLQFLAQQIANTYFQPNELREILRDIEMNLNRLHQTAFEIASLLQRYQAFLYGDDRGCVLCEVHVGKGEKKIVATFEVSEGYPFSPVTVDVEGDTDLEEIQRILKRGAKPGFGFIARTCNMLQAHLQLDADKSRLRKTGSIEDNIEKH